MNDTREYFNNVATEWHAMRKRFFGARVIGVDLSERMLQQVSSRLAGGSVTRDLRM